MANVTAEVTTETPHNDIDALLSEKLQGLSPDVLRAIAEVFPSDDPLDKPDFSTIGYINTLFPTEQSLATIDSVIQDVDKRIDALDDELRMNLQDQSVLKDDGQAALVEAEQGMEQLFTKIMEMEADAKTADETVQSLTSDIKELDRVKRNLTTSITAIEQLNVLVNGSAKLATAVRNRDYASANAILAGVQSVLQEFKKYEHIDEIRSLAEEIRSLQRQLSVGVVTDFKGVFKPTGEPVPMVPAVVESLRDGCKILDVIQDSAKSDLMEWFIDYQLEEYRLLFAESQPNAWLDQFDKRLSWIKQKLVDFDRLFLPLFPPDWLMSERLCVSACKLTKTQLSSLMSSRRHLLDANTLLHALMKTLKFEELLQKRYTGATLIAACLDADNDDELDEKNPFHESTSTSNRSRPQSISSPTSKHPPTQQQIAKEHDTKSKLEAANPFKGVISVCFEPYLDIYIDHQDKNLTKMIEQFAKDAVAPTDDEHKTRKMHQSPYIMSSSSDLFVFYRDFLKQTAQFSRREPLLRLAQVLQHHLRQYAKLVLLGCLPRQQQGGKSAANAVSAMQVSANNMVATAGGFLQIFRDAATGPAHGGLDGAKLSDDEISRVCRVVCTAEYCLETTKSLQSKLVDLIDAQFKEKIDFSAEEDVFHKVAKETAIQLLVLDLDSSCETALIAMSKSNWSTVNANMTVEPSAFVQSLSTHWRRVVPRVRSGLKESRKFFAKFCVDFASSFLPKVSIYLYRCKPLSDAGVHQLRIDMQALKNGLMMLPEISLLGSAPSQAPRKPLQAYTALVQTKMTRIDHLLQVLLIPTQPANNFIDGYKGLVSDPDVNELSKLLDMKDVRRSEHIPFVDLFKQGS